MKKFYTSIIFVIVFITANAQTPSWVWAKSAGGSGIEHCYISATDGAGNVYIIGDYNSPTFTSGATTLANAGNNDIYFVKYDPLGNTVWAKSIGGTGNDGGWSITTDAANNVYVTGNYNSPTITFGTTTLTNVGNFDVFIAKYDTSGNLLWAKGAGSIGKDECYSVITDVSGNVYITGDFNSSITFGSTTLTSVGDFDIFIVKYDSLGNVIWAKREGSSQYDYGRCIATDVAGNVYITGGFNSPTIIFGATILNNGGAFDLFTVKYNSAGNVIWAKSAGNIGNDYGNNIIIDVNQNVYLTGYHDSPSLTFGAITLISGGSFDAYMVKYDYSGNELWAQGAGNIEDDYGSGMIADANGYVYLVGCYHSANITFGTSTITNIGGYDIFIVKYDPNGNVLWVQNVGGTGDEIGRSLNFDQYGNIYLTGEHNLTVNFGTNAISSLGNWDTFIAKLGNNSNGWEEQNLGNAFTIFPNPSNGIFTFKDSKNIKTIEVYNLMGEMVLSQGNAKQIDLQGFPQGIYVAKINGQFVSKLVKE